MDENALKSVRPPAACECESLKARVEDLEAKVEDIEAVLAGLMPLPQRRSGVVISWLKALLQTHSPAPGSTIGGG